MTLASGVGSMPGGEVGQEADNARSYSEVTRIVLGELDLPHVPELPGRGAVAGMVGRTMGLITELGSDLQPAGWRLTDAAGVDQRRARSLLSQDLDTVEDQAQQVAGWFKTQVCGPWTLAATVERPRGDRVLADAGARRDLSQALALAVADHVADLRRRVPDAQLLVQVDEPALPAVLAAQVPTASGFGRHRTVHPPEASESLAWVLSAITEAGATPVVHCCAADVPVELLTGAGAAGVSVDLGVLAADAYEGLAAVLDSGGWALLGVVPALEPVGYTDREPVRALERFLDMVGLAPTPTTVVTPSCGLAGATSGWARRALEIAQHTAQEWDEKPAQ